MGSSSHGGERKGQLGPVVTLPMSGTHLKRDEGLGPHKRHGEMSSGVVCSLWPWYETVA